MLHPLGVSQGRDDRVASWRQPVFEAQVGDILELVRVVGDEGQVVQEGNSRPDGQGTASTWIAEAEELLMHSGFPPMGVN
jgi:hypothetical protein